MNLTKPLLFAVLVAGASMSFAQTPSAAPAHKAEATAPAASKPMHAKPHHEAASKHHGSKHHEKKHHATDAKPHKESKPAEGAVPAPTK